VRLDRGEDGIVSLGGRGISAALTSRCTRPI
jgi:hypothetical protein